MGTRVRANHNIVVQTHDRFFTNTIASQSVRRKLIIFEGNQLFVSEMCEY